MVSLGILVLALCASLPASADSFGARYGREAPWTGYAGGTAYDNAAKSNVTSTAALASLTARRLSLVCMDIIGNSGETTPEPSSLILLGGGLMAAFITMRRGLTR